MDTLIIGETNIRLVRGDITEAVVDAVVNAANSSLMGGGGVDGAIHSRGGPAILEACRDIRQKRYPDGLPTGEAVITTGGHLPSRYVIHTVGPIWRGGKTGEVDLLAWAYRSVLKLAHQNRIRTIAFPSISTGAYGFPIKKAAVIALKTTAEGIRKWIDSFEEIRFVLFSEQDRTVYSNALDLVRINFKE